MRIVLALLLVSATASAHTTLTSPPPRTLANKAGPCGAAGSTRGTKVTTFAPGEVITVEWDETVDHPGHYRVAFDDDGDDVFVNPNNPNDNFAFTLMDQIPDKSGGHYTQQITLPTTPCTNCTLQLIQIMTTQVPYNSFYFQCADITIAEGGGSGSGSDTDPGTEGGCSTGSGAGAGAAAIVFLAGLVARRKRR
jgi:MYXO-CTERM domain-containing protein